jgi:hypothetical protein
MRSGGELAPVPPSRVARFIATEPAESALQLADDGKLPELHLCEPGRAATKEERSRGMNPLLLFGLLCLSGLASVAMALIPNETQTRTDLEKKHEARQIIEAEFFRDMDDPGPTKLYQQKLRDAQLARSRGESKIESRLYREVLDMLRAERNRFDRGLTGNPMRDRRLEEQLKILLSK